jgi:hypothetical protein
LCLMSMMDGMQAKCGACLAVDGIPKAFNCFGFCFGCGFFGFENMDTVCSATVASRALYSCSLQCTCAILTQSRVDIAPANNDRFGSFFQARKDRPLRAAGK